MIKLIKIATVIGILALTLSVASAKTIYIPDDYAKIQWAVDNATDGDMIIVRDGIYTENIKVNNSVTIKSLSDNPSDTIIQANDRSHHVFEVHADNVTISGFTIKNARSTAGLPGGATPPAGVYLRSDNCTISNNIFERNWYGVYLSYGSSNNAIINSQFKNTTGWPIYAYSSSHNIIRNNTFLGGGIQLYYYSSNNEIENNTISFSPIGIYLNNFCNYNKIKNNVIYNSTYEGINIYQSDFNQLRGNTITLSETGVLMEGADNTILANNTIRQNYVGVHLFSGCKNNLIYNNFFENDINAHGTGAEWNITKKAGRNIIGGNYLGGNYWSDYLGKDLDGDGIGDTNIPHTCNNRIEGDWLPLVYILPVHNINTSEDFSTIQDAINDPDTQNGHVIVIDPGRYEENVNVTKELTITSVGGAEIIAENSENHVFKILANNVTISNLTISRANKWSGIFCKAGIYAYKVNNTKILNNSINNNSCGIYLYYSSNSIIEDNRLLNNDYGIYLHCFAHSNLIKDNEIKLSEDGIHFEYYSNENTVHSNIVVENDCGIHAYQSSNNLIYNNYFNNKINAQEVSSNNKWNLSGIVIQIN